MPGEKWLFLCIYGLLFGITVSNNIKAGRPSFKIASSTTSSSPVTTMSEDLLSTKYLDDKVMKTMIPLHSSNKSIGHSLTGIPQIDYIWDPNLPRELKGYNLSDYPFYSSMPEDIDFKCDGLHDGFYASVPHKCQVYHHCLFGTRYDFLCANFTAFDQRTFICHFVSEVDCTNSKKFWHRNEALYKTTTTTTLSPIITPIVLVNTEKKERVPLQERNISVRRRRPLVRRPLYDYYYEYYYDEDDNVRPRGYNRRDYEEYDNIELRSDRERNLDSKHRDSHETNKKRYLSRANRRNIFRDINPLKSEDISFGAENEHLLQKTTEQHFLKNSNITLYSAERSLQKGEKQPRENGSSTKLRYI
ncbi:uncharacterized protein LOC106646906 [Copidosoma floridanum]|uniref:uncharacterized protein LOC106646906 n=1 Tax=Copidosoma floridanum TaxID=29053 RepID=UPI0006C9B350|nr:uncharacterized protein LOC106646906 [Copidosoma floridanum]